MILSKCLCYFQTFHHQYQLCSVMSETSCLFGITGTLLYLPYERGGVKFPNLRWNYTAGVTSRSHLVNVCKIKYLYMDGAFPIFDQLCEKRLLKY